MITHKDLVRARILVVKRAKRELPNHIAFDTKRSSVEAGLIVVGFDVDGTARFSNDLVSKHYERIRHACMAVNGPRPIDLFAAAISTGIIYGAQAERMKNESAQRI